MSDDLREKLRRLGVRQGTAGLKPRRAARKARRLKGGHEVETPLGPAYVIETRFELDFFHGEFALSEALAVPGSVLAELACDAPGQSPALERAAFIDTETTGLAGGTGTLAFLVGLGTFDAARGAFGVSQFFLRQPGEEAALLAALERTLAGCGALVTFNGRGFDVPLLQTRFTLQRRRPAVLNAPHLDLLLPARRVWRDRLPSCALSSLETHVLGVCRSQSDVPGYLIPQLYFDYLRTGDASEMPRVLYHNTQDILSLVALLACLGHLLADPLADAALDPLDLLSLARWRADTGRTVEAESLLRAALERRPPKAVRAAAWQQLGFLLKRQARYEEACLAWQQLAAASADVVAHVELAKHYEWRATDRDIRAALHWTRAGLAQLETWRPGLLRERAQAELLHRQKRLERKLR